jgi:hypothetical protein
MTMSLRDFGVFAPLKEDHPAIGDRCWKCKGVFGIGTRTAINPIETADQSGSLTVRGELVCATCHLRGKECVVPIDKGNGKATLESRIIERVKEGDASPYPVETTDGKQWNEKEVVCSTAP